MILQKLLKTWGVGFTSSLPPEFIVTEHAEDRLLHRFICSKNKLKKIVVKAWYSKETSFELLKLQKKNIRKVIRQFSGRLFVFAIKHNARYNVDQKHLITVIDPHEFYANQTKLWKQGWRKKVCLSRDFRRQMAPSNPRRKNKN